MKIHLPLPIRRSLLAGIACAAAGCINGAFAMAESQNLTFDGTTLTWNTDADNAVFLTADGTASHFTPGNNVSFTNNATVTLGEDITAGTIKIESEADVIILQDNYVLEAERIELAGTLDAGDSLTIDNGTILAVESAQAILNSNLVLGNGSNLASGAAANLNGNTLTLHGGTGFTLAATGDGKTYTLFTGVTELKDSQGNAITLDSTNNAISNYFDTTQPGTGFWADATLVFNDGTLQLMRHNETVKEAVTITPRQNNGADYQYHAGVTFENLVTSSDGGAIYGGYGNTITLSNNGSVTFSSNSAESGGAVYGSITINANGNVEFGENKASSFGGAICTRSGDVTINGNGTISFRNNSATASVEYGSAQGGAVQVDGDITMIDNQSVEFVNNFAFTPYHTSLGGAIESWGNIRMTNNGSVSFRNNSAWVAETIYPSACGGAIWHGSDEILLNDNGYVEFIDNRAMRGGAIETQARLSIRNNGSTLFEKNTELYGEAYRLRSIYSTGSGVSLSADEGQSIEFRDSIYVGTRCTSLELNASYIDSNNATHTQQGDIIFTGKYTETHLNEILAADNAGRKATDDEIRNSRTTEVNTMTNLYGGRLRVEDGAVYKGNGITAHANSAATVRVKDAELSHVGYDLTFNAGTVLEVAGASTIRGNVELLEKSMFRLEQAASLSLHETQAYDAATLEVNGTALLEGNSTLNASLTLANGATLDMGVLEAGAVTLNGALTFAGEVYMGTHLQDILSEMRGRNESITLFTGLTNLVLPDTLNEDATDRVWVGDVFSNMAGNQTHYLTYEANAGSLSVVYVPETTTTTLSLLALATLTMRRRRK